VKTAYVLVENPHSRDEGDTTLGVFASAWDALASVVELIGPDHALEASVDSDGDLNVRSLRFPMPSYGHRSFTAMPYFVGRRYS
jgi:hypothetical protein